MQYIVSKILMLLLCLALLNGCSKKPEMVIVEGETRHLITVGDTTTPRTYVKRVPIEQLITNSGQIYELERMPDYKFRYAPSKSHRIIKDGKERYRCKGILKGNVFEAYEITRLN